MSFVIHGPSYSTYVRSVRLAFEEKGAAYELAEVDILKGENKQPAYQALQPFGPVPAFEHDGFKLYETDEWKKLFGDFGKPYLDTYKPHPFSRKYVAHLSGWYAQKHPDEDFAETFAVLLTPGSKWAERYKGWGALKKLQYVEATAKRVGRMPPLVQLAQPDVTTEQMEGTVQDHYRQRELDEKVDRELPNGFHHATEDLLWGPRQAPGAAPTPKPKKP